MAASNKNPHPTACIEAAADVRSGTFLYLLRRLWATHSDPWKGRRWLMYTREELADRTNHTVHQVDRYVRRLKAMELLVSEQHRREGDWVVVAFIRPGDRAIAEVYKPAGGGADA